MHTIVNGQYAETFRNKKPLRKGRRGNLRFFLERLKGKCRHPRQKIAHIQQGSYLKISLFEVMAHIKEKLVENGILAVADRPNRGR